MPKRLALDRRSTDLDRDQARTAHAILCAEAPTETGGVMTPAQHYGKHGDSRTACFLERQEAGGG